jgi:hypothetical protein
MITLEAETTASQTFTLDDIKAKFKFWDAYRYLKAEYPGWKLRHPNWLAILDAFNNPPETELTRARKRIAELEAQLSEAQASKDQAAPTDVLGAAHFVSLLAQTEDDPMAAIQLINAAVQLDAPYGEITRILITKGYDYCRMYLAGSLNETYSDLAQQWAAEDAAREQRNAERRAANGVPPRRIKGKRAQLSLN